LEKQRPVHGYQNQNFEHQSKGSFIVQLRDMESDDNINKERTNFHQQVFEENSKGTIWPKVIAN